MLSTTIPLVEPPEAVDVTGYPLSTAAGGHAPARVFRFRAMTQPLIPVALEHPGATLVSALLPTLKKIQSVLVAVL